MHAATLLAWRGAANQRDRENVNRVSILLAVVSVTWCCLACPLTDPKMQEASRSHLELTLVILKALVMT